jgi:hypothetical protein
MFLIFLILFERMSMVLTWGEFLMGTILDPLEKFKVDTLPPFLLFQLCH